jgi:septal ring factor EnvC (AmiA/AmiB activator)
MADFINVLFAYNLQTLDILKGVRRDMANLNDNVAELREAVAALAERVANQAAPLTEALDNVRAELEAERAKYAELVTAEDAEDVQQNAALDTALDDADAAAAQVAATVDELNAIAVAPAEAEAPAAPVADAPVADVPPVEDVPVAQAPVAEAPVEEPTEDDDPLHQV